MHEIIHVVDAETSSGTRQGLEVEAVDGRPLAPGYYFVLWPTKARTSRPRGKRYFGPFPTRVQARVLLTSAVALGLAENEHVRQAVAECRSTVRPAHAAGESQAPPRPLPWLETMACLAC